MIKFLNKINKNKLKGVALLRLDFNTEDFWRIDLTLSNIIFLKKYANKIIIISHKGRPNNFDLKFSLKPQVKYLENKLKTKIKFINHFNFENIKNTIIKSEQKIFVLENIRFLKEEYSCNQQLAYKLAQLGDYFVNDAFAVCHRSQTSVTELPKFLPSYAGFQLEKEIKILEKNIKKPTKPLILIIGGAKAKDKIGVIKNFINKAKYILLGGGSGNTMLFLKNINVYESLREKDQKILNDFKKLLKYENIILPIDYKINQNQILDIGPQTIKLFKEKIKIAKTIIWSGPLGMIEDKRYIQGSLEIAKSIISNPKANTIVGGGETVMFLKKHNLDKKIKFISTGGGAMLEFLAGKKLPGIEILKNAKKIRKRI